MSTHHVSLESIFQRTVSGRCRVMQSLDVMLLFGVHAKRKKKKVQLLGLDSQLMANKGAAIHLWVCHCCCCRRRFWVPFCLPDIYMDGDELCVKTGPKVHRSQNKKGPDSHIIFWPFSFTFFSLRKSWQTKQLWGSEKVYQHLLAASFFSSLSFPISRFETRDNWFPLCRSVALFSQKKKSA